VGTWTRLINAGIEALQSALSSKSSDVARKTDASRTGAARQGSRVGGDARTRPGARPASGVRPEARANDGLSSLGQNGATRTVELEPPASTDLVITYAPDPDRDPDAGEVVWTWVPYEEGDGRGKDRPVLVIGRHTADRVYAVRLTSKAHDGERDFLSIGTGAWDSQGRESWVDIEQLYSVHRDGMRREAAALDAGRYARVAAALTKRYGWRFAR
jgi:mRNA-degrading endonuclease toxin of MazEF toxin-antitoxin module